MKPVTNFSKKFGPRADDMHVPARRRFFSLRLGDRIIMNHRFRNCRLLRWHLLYLRYHRVPIVRKRLRWMDFNNRTFFFSGNGEQNRNQSGDPKNCGK